MRTLAPLVLLLTACREPLPDSYGIPCDETGAVCTDGLECLEVRYQVDTGSWGEQFCTRTCEVDADCPVSWTLHCGAEQLLCVNGVCGDFTCH